MNNNQQTNTMNNNQQHGPFVESAESAKFTYSRKVTGDDLFGNQSTTQYNKQTSSNDIPHNQKEYGQRKRIKP
jgi:hypothetical protein